MSPARDGRRLSYAGFSRRPGKHPADVRHRSNWTGVWRSIFTHLPSHEGFELGKSPCSGRRPAFKPFLSFFQPGIPSAVSMSASHAQDLSRFVPVGHIWKFDLEQYEQRIFGVKCNFSKNRIEPVMLKFLATTENLRNARSEQPLEQLLFAISRYKNHTRAELSYPEIGDRTITKEEYIDSKWTRVNLRWKGGQPKSPNGPTQNLSSQVKTHFLCWNLLIANFSSYYIYARVAS